MSRTAILYIFFHHFNAWNRSYIYMTFVYFTTPCRKRMILYDTASMLIPRFEVGNFRGSCFSAFFPLYSLAGFSRRVGWLPLPTRKTCLSPFERTIVAGGSGWLIFDRVCTILREECSLRYVWRKNRRRYAQGRVEGAKRD